ncbi:MAG: Maf family protein [bacterium]|nr:Maf family protein [bacterium]MCM1374152.1 Maf family protein [Muribaculum sp.]
MRIVLASGSPRRRELLAGLGLEYTVLVSGVEEHVTKREPAEVVEELSAQKAYDVFQSLISETSGEKLSPGDEREDILVIGADTIVAVDGEILGKPADEKEAAQMLERLSGRRHQVYTGVTLHGNRQGEILRHTFYECTQVEFYPMTEEEILWYISTGEPMDKAGAYGIQGMGGRFVRAIEGDYNNVVGLPVARLYQELKAMHII